MLKILTLLALPMAAAKMRGQVPDPSPEAAFPTRQLMGEMGGSGGGCPDPGDAPGILCNNNSDCMGSPFCAGRDDCCCVAYTYSYCGVPSDCNQYLQCVPDSDATPPPGVPDPFVSAAADSFELLNAVATCLAETIGDGMPPPMDSEDMPPPPMDSDDSPSKSSKSSKAGKKSGKSAGKKMKRTKIVGEPKEVEMSSGDY
mmetsp:Transcript_127762/g.190393  ORF Transcript_127762/g.190393 Transcript_127762/m.190393 type:complete len:200 (-) Transcript_127762:72-671(-)|eukprot:CAMPEP_0117052724 /NCGR_PEP_ID=MMETSP0472-20121206/36448_1 /TAXON_ID=693140 ORGANISM="Tiarina fusus, Strain LIS" /NCGR_SAMPLE_ID=MMETSP0472 /ASSEMBLY_ACC=CAM_ASM_000603 /LENGTH=199 /DNA_ID=CAMNT_0004767467 /DNA_START=42 /DNA_END=641 /DNA_ORIENTATION=-